MGTIALASKLDVSLSELSSLTRLALRGAGYDWGHAEDGAAWVTWLARYDLPITDVLTDYLATPRTPSCVCPIIAAAGLSDTGGLPNEGVHIDNLAAPLLILPVFAAEGLAYRVTWNAFAFDIAQGELRRMQGVDELGGGVASRVTIEPLDQLEGEALPLRTRAIISTDAWHTLKALAAQTFAPATQASRDGAGAGDDGNDD